MRNQIWSSKPCDCIFHSVLPWSNRLRHVIAFPIGLLFLPAVFMAYGIFFVVMKLDGGKERWWARCMVWTLDKLRLVRRIELIP